MRPLRYGPDRLQRFRHPGDREGHPDIRDYLGESGIRKLIDLAYGKDVGVIAMKVLKVGGRRQDLAARKDGGAALFQAMLKWALENVKLAAVVTEVLNESQMEQDLAVVGRPLRPGTGGLSTPTLPPTPAKPATSAGCVRPPARGASGRRTCPGAWYTSTATKRWNVPAPRSGRPWGTALFRPAETAAPANGPALTVFRSASGRAAPPPFSPDAIQIADRTCVGFGILGCDERRYAPGLDPENRSSGDPRGYAPLVAGRGSVPRPRKGGREREATVGRGKRGAGSPSKLTCPAVLNPL